MSLLNILKPFGIVLFLIASVFEVHSQNAPVLFQPGAKSDSSSTAYEAPLPLFNKAFTKMGVAFPQPYGASVRVYYDTEDLDIENLTLGLNGGGLNNLDGILGVNSYTQSAQTVSFQADAWVLPFLNVYGMAGITNIESEAKLDVPWQSDYVLDIETKGSFVGFGATLAGIFGPVYISGNMQSVHSFSENQNQGDVSITSGLRVGPVFNFKNKPKRNLVVWVGGIYSNYTNTSSGTYEAIDLFPQAQQTISRELTNLENWYNGLNAADQAKYKAQYNEVTELLNDVNDNVNDTEIDYKLDKRLEMPWDLAIGAEYQLGPKFLIKGEGQFIGSRTAFLFSMNYRFGNN